MSKHQRLIRVRFLGASNYRGRRISLTENRYHVCDRKTIGYDYAIGDGLKQAIAYLENECHMNIVGYGMWQTSSGHDYYIMSDSWSDDSGAYWSIKGELRTP